MVSWIKIEERLPTEEETIEGRVPVICEDGALRYGLLCGPAGGDQFLLSEIEATHWLPVPHLKE